MIYRYSIPTVKRGTITISRDLNEERTGAIPSSMKKLLQRRNIRLSQIFFLFFPFYFTHLFLQDHSTLSFIRYTHDNLNKASEFRLFGISTLFYFSSQSDERYVTEETDFLFMETHQIIQLFNVD